MTEGNGHPTDLSLVPVDQLIEEIVRRFDTSVILLNRIMRDDQGEYIHRTKGDPFSIAGLILSAHVESARTLKQMHAQVRPPEEPS